MAVLGDFQRVEIPLDRLTAAEQVASTQVPSHLRHQRLQVRRRALRLGMRPARPLPKPLVVAAAVPSQPLKEYHRAEYPNEP